MKNIEKTIEYADPSGLEKFVVWNELFNNAKMLAK